MTLLVTGATGFVMSVLGRHWLDTHPGERLVVLDAAAPDAACRRYFADVAERLPVVAAGTGSPPIKPTVWWSSMRPRRTPPAGATLPTWRSGSTSWSPT